VGEEADRGKRANFQHTSDTGQDLDGFGWSAVGMGREEDLRCLK